MAPAVAVEWLGRVPYERGLALQECAVRERLRGATGDRLLLLEHPPVITLGRRARSDNVLLAPEELARRGVEVHRVGRGGDVTWHAPGQLVGYLVADLAAEGAAPDVGRLLRGLERRLVEVAEALGVPARPLEGLTGIFVDRQRSPRPQGAERKLASIGLGLRRWVSFHGFALNVSVDLAGFGAIVPCGLEQVEMTSLAREGAPAEALDERARRQVVEAFSRGLP